MHRDDLPPWMKTLSDLDMKGDWEPAAAMVSANSMQLLDFTVEGPRLCAWGNCYYIDIILTSKWSELRRNLGSVSYLILCNLAIVKLTFKSFLGVIENCYCRKQLL
ncbi:LOW QUALITY PROTEIN: hypothetical protein NC652_004666 [Populus alba x Populus x berolinensis]|nr:LOW QUALITY PROTEIN: hypothetical protein NC652_004666 [Populus alba x Populus x berolinensis]